MTIQEIYSMSDSYKEFKRETGLTEEEDKKYWEKFSNNPESQLMDLVSTWKMIEKVKEKAKIVSIYASDDSGFQWYFACTGRMKKTDKYFSITFMKTEIDGITVREAHCSEISLSEILAL